jgi:plasmid stabilization system protein ParE
VTEAEAADRVMSHVPESDRAQLGPLALVILYAIIGGVVSWFVQRMLNRCTAKGMRSPGPVARWRLDRAIRRACEKALADNPDAIWVGLDAADDRAEIEAAARAALLAAAANIGDEELTRWRAAGAGREG